MKLGNQDTAYEAVAERWIWKGIFIDAIGKI